MLRCTSRLILVNNWARSCAEAVVRHLLVAYPVICICVCIEFVSTEGERVNPRPDCIWCSHMV